MNLANKLTVSRIFVIPLFLVTLVPREFGLPNGWHPLMRTFALLLFIAASLTDYWDGMLARRHGWVTNFGKLMDPLADKVLVMTAFVGMVALRLFPSWMVVLILCREFLITGLRMLASAQGRVLGADRWGKNKTITQLTTIITALTYLAARDWLMMFNLWDVRLMHRWHVETSLSALLHLMMLICVILTAWSGWRYCRENWDVFRDM